MTTFSPNSSPSATLGVGSDVKEHFRNIRYSRMSKGGFDNGFTIPRHRAPREDTATSGDCNNIAVPMEDFQTRSALGIPDSHCPVIRPTENAAPIGRKCHAPNLTFMTAQDGQFPSALGIPDSHSLVIRPAENAAAIGRKLHSPHLDIMAAEDGQFPPALGIPDSHGLVIRSAENVVAIR